MPNRARGRASRVFSFVNMYATYRYEGCTRKDRPSTEASQPGEAHLDSPPPENVEMKKGVSGPIEAFIPAAGVILWV